MPAGYCALHGLHVKAILRKLGIHSRVEAAVLAVEHGLGKKQER